ncbi:hypothetical protein E2C01_073655 [Portunus trituberculatus]|uniref:Uncharacterized protein n=1 Tax=Portunus trituberculatus TaxID=210409 RepID=A0A5B7I5X5_PORTR|nr:hypothetical protein [Portunus trituberculatus]
MARRLPTKHRAQLLSPRVDIRKN